MIYTFGDFQIDFACGELRRRAVVIDIEPMAFQLLQHLIENRDRLVSKRELFDVLWEGRAVSDAALTTCVKSARRAVSDTGQEQAVIRTVHGKGLRWVAPLQVLLPAQAKTSGQDLDAEQDVWVEAAKGPSIAILPFDVFGSDAAAQTLSEAIPHELIATIARLRWVTVIARGSSFRFQSGTSDLDEVGRKLGVRYCLTGSVKVLNRQVSISVVLSDTEDGQVIWADRFRSAMADVHEVREKIVAQVIFAVEVQIPLSEAMKARLRTPDNIDAWATYHLGLQSLYKFDETENDRAAALFRKAVELEPGFARAHAALSFAHFKTAFMHYGTDRDVAMTAARAASEKAIELDPMDPFANFNMGRSLWLVGDLEGAKSWLNRATTLSPNFAQGIYARSWTETLLGSSETGRRLSDEARLLSPLDPLLYAMLGTRAISLMLEERHAEAAEWGARAANAPGAHHLISMIAVFTNELAGNHKEAAAWAQKLRTNRCDATQDHFFRSFPFSDPAVCRRISMALNRHGLPKN